MSKRLIALAAAALLFTACSAAPTPRQLAKDAVTAMGGAEKLQSIQTISMKGGTGTRLRLGQTQKVTDAEVQGQLKDVVEIADLANGRASLDYTLQIGAGGFMQHRHEVLTKRGDKPVGVEYVGTRPVIATSPGGLFSWGTQNSPEFLLRRNVISVALAAADSASDAQPAADANFNGKMVKSGTARTKSGEEITLYFDPQSKLLAGFQALDTETMLGDVQSQYILEDYKAVDGITLPHKITIGKGGKDYSSVQYTSIAINDPEAQKVFEIPEAASAEADQAIAAGEYSPVKLNKVDNGVWHAAAYSHHSMIVEFPAYLAVVEAPYTEAQIKTLARALEQQFPGKPIKYAAVTHHHYDHTGGVRAIAALGATVLVEKGHEPALREILDARHTNPQDELDKRRNAQPPQPTGSLEVFEGKKVISDGGQSLELYAIRGNPHVDPKVIAYVPGVRAVFASDIWSPAPNVAPGSANADARHLLDSIRQLNLKVDKMVGGHGGVGPFSDLVKAATGTAKPSSN
jgi:glyoxylase-like metal-dependent hydrolase (beta-lactamase superfamily II)